LFGGWFQDLKRRLTGLRPYAWAITAVLLVNLTALGVGTYLYLEAGPPERGAFWWFRERNVMATLDVAQLVIGGAAGIAAYQLFWSRSGFDSKEAAGIFLWGIGGAGLMVFAFDDYMGLHEQFGRRFENTINALPLATNMPDDLLVLSYAFLGLALLFVFRMELFEDRASATLLQAAGLASLVMVTTDAFTTARFLLALEYPAQTLASSLLLLAFVVRYLEVTSGGREVANSTLEVAAQ
jgi:hypothetical protein